MWSLKEIYYIISVLFRCLFKNLKKKFNYWFYFWTYTVTFLSPHQAVFNKQTVFFQNLRLVNFKNHCNFFQSLLKILYNWRRMHALLLLDKKNITMARYLTLYGNNSLLAFVYRCFVFTFGKCRSFPINTIIKGGIRKKISLFVNNGFLAGSLSFLFIT